MATSIVRSRARQALLGPISALLLVATGASPALAAGSVPFQATFAEVTTPRACPPGTPPNAFCYQGAGYGPVTPPGDPNGTERFAGFVDQNRADPVTHCAPDFNVVSITTNRGTLYLTTNGVACPTSLTTSVDQGTWRAFGGTGIFSGARGSGTVSTAGTFNADGTISSTSTYNGSLTLN